MMRFRFALILFLFSVVEVVAQNPFSIYGIARNSTPAQAYFARVQPGTGVVTEISPISLGTSYVLNALSAIDPVNGRYYYSPSASTILSIDMMTGLVADTLVLSSSFSTNFDMMQYNCRDSTLYGIQRSNNPTALFLAKVDLQTGAITTISPTSVGSSFVLNAKSTLDPFTNCYYLYTGAGFTSIDLTTGLVNQVVPVTFSGPGLFFDLMTYNCADGDIYGLNRAQQTICPAKIDPITGIVTNLSNTSITNSFVLNCMAEINPLVGSFHFYAGPTFITFDLANGSVLANPTLSFAPVPGNNYFDLIARDNCKCALSNDPNGVAEIAIQNRVVAFPNPADAGQLVTLQLRVGITNPQVLVVDALGRQVAFETTQASPDTLTINTLNLIPGIYSVLVADDNQKTVRTSFIVR